VTINWAKIADAIERTGATFAETFIAFEIANQAHITQITEIKTAAIAAGIAAGKYVIVQLNAFLGSKGSVSAVWGK